MTRPPDDPREATRPTPAELARLEAPLDPALVRAAAVATSPGEAEVARLLARSVAADPVVRSGPPRGSSPAPRRPPWWAPLLGAGLATAAFAAASLRWEEEPTRDPVVEAAPARPGSDDDGASDAEKSRIESGGDAPIGDPPSPAAAAPPVSASPVEPPARSGSPARAPRSPGPPREPSSSPAVPAAPVAPDTAPAPSVVPASPAAAPPDGSQAAAFAALLERRDAGEASAELLAAIAAFRARWPGSAFDPEAEVLTLEVGATTWPAARAERTLRAWLDAHPADARRPAVLWAWAGVVDGRLGDCTAAIPAWDELAAGTSPVAVAAAQRRSACYER